MSLKADQRFPQETGELKGVGSPSLRALQFRARASDAALHARDGGRRDGSALDVA